jgi:hypothetical protein
MEQRNGFVPSTPWRHCSGLVWMARKQGRSFWPSFAPTRAAGGAPRPETARPSMTSEANVAVAWPHDVEPQIEDEAD